MYWLILGAAIVLEVSGTVCMKLAFGFSRLAPSVLVFVFYGFSLAGLTVALKRIPVSTAYAIWSGLGTALITFVGAYAFREGLGALKILFILLIIIGVMGLHWLEAGH